MACRSPPTPRPCEELCLTRAVPWLLLVFGIARVVAAARLDLFGDEAFYWMCSQRLALAYADHPFVTALLVRAGTDLLGARPLGVRVAFLLLGALLPLALYWLARPLVGRRDATLAAGAALLVPVLAVGGVLALPDVPLVLLSALALACFERATRDGRTAAWLGAGAATALAFATHYRALLIPLGFLPYLLATARGRAQWRRPGAWAALALALLGTLPALLFNLEHGFAPLRFQGIERHAASPGLEGVLDHLRLQALALSPPLYVALLAAGVGLVRRALRGDDRAALLASFSLAHLGAFLVASPWSDPDHVSLHWTASGYLPLLVALPSALTRFASRGGTGAGPDTATRLRRGLAAFAPAFALLCVALLHLELATRVFGVREIDRAFGGWSSAVAAARAALPAIPPAGDGRPLLVADDYLLAGNLELRLRDDAQIYVLDHPKHHRHGRALQFRIWGIDEAALRRHAGAQALVVIDRDQSRSAAWRWWQRHVASLFDELVPQAAIRAAGRRPEAPRFHFYQGIGVRAGGAAPP